MGGNDPPINLVVSLIESPDRLLASMILLEIVKEDSRRGGAQRRYSHEGSSCWLGYNGLQTFLSEDAPMPLMNCRVVSEDFTLFEDVPNGVVPNLLPIGVYEDLTFWGCTWGSYCKKYVLVANCCEFNSDCLGFAGKVVFLILDEIALIVSEWVVLTDLCYRVIRFGYWCLTPKTRLVSCMSIQFSAGARISEDCFASCRSIVFSLVLESGLTFSCLPPDLPINSDEEKREELFENLKLDDSIGWEVDVIDPWELSAKMTKINLNEISHNSTMGLVKRVLDVGVLLTEVKRVCDTVGDAEKYRVKLSERFPGIQFVVAKKVDSRYPVVSGACIVAKVERKLLKCRTCKYSGA
ncbi:hypothetical protein ZIOFF_060967 [Zingiber officinale]|uniref:Ribonuclease n=1 Tax=Zingiber officinale TaxID=94328 RepID=A0A8J5KM52_ZINOF|nr:hypothetical protein ZIOFF_060967 [Zingiber officinale]